jgi:FlaA1/EpsC-like NDP-sugar epimerase
MLSRHLLKLPRAVKRLLVLLLDASLCVLTVWLAYYLRIGEFISLSSQTELAVGANLAIGISIVLFFPIFLVTGLYSAVFRYSSWPAVLSIAWAVGLYGVLFAVVITVIGVDGVPRTVGLIQPLLLLFFVGGSRVSARFLLGDKYRRVLGRAAQLTVLIYGAGHAGQQLASALASGSELQIVGFLDDDKHLHGQMINGKRVYNPKNLASVVRLLGIKHVLLAMPSISRYRRHEILNDIRSVQVSVRSVPSVSDLAQGRISFSDLRELDLDDLLGRETATPIQALLAKNVIGKTVAVTGAGGSIGGELCRQIMSIGPSKLLLIEQSEFLLYEIHKELSEKYSNANAELIPILASVQDESRMQGILFRWQPSTLYHAAAYKHVPLVEYNSAEGIKNNVLGTLCTAKAAIAAKVSDFVLISTDKAVRPTNVMGASKRLAEMILQGLAELRPVTNFSIVRFGNVLDSSGSVVPKFRQQIGSGGPVTVTHPEVTRFFMTIQEAAQLVIQAGAMADGGDVFVLNMGNPIYILDLARRMIELSGLTVRDKDNRKGDIEIQFTGLRPGEKLYEEPLTADNPVQTIHPRIFRAREGFVPWAELTGHLAPLETAIRNNDVISIRRRMEEIVPGYAPSGGMVDSLLANSE